MLSELERDRLVNRRTQTPRDRATNDMRVRKKLSAWLKNVPDVLLILEKLPDDQIRDVLTDNDIFQLFRVNERLVDIKGFTPIIGRLTDEKWIGHFGEVGDLDIWRAFQLHQHITRLGLFSGNGGPMIDMEIFEQKEKHPDLYTITEEERRGAARVRRAIESTKFRQAHPGAEPYPDKETMWANAKRATEQEKPSK